MPSYTSTFIFQVKLYDEEFNRFNNEIAARAKAFTEFLGEEAWTNESTGLCTRRFTTGTVSTAYESEPGA